VRNTHYLARRYLGYSPREFDALPWHERRMFIEGLRFEFEGEDADPDEVVDSTPAALTSSFGVTVKTA
jgi:hypothetical protein